MTRRHAPQRRARALQGTNDIDFKHAAGRFRIECFQRCAAAGDACIVDEAGKAAKALIHRGEQPLDIGGICDIRLHGDRPATLRCDLTNQRMRTGLRALVIDTHGVTVTRQQARGFRSDASAGSCYEDNAFHFHTFA